MKFERLVKMEVNFGVKLKGLREQLLKVKIKKKSNKHG
jgi:hypothetical protein